MNSENIWLVAALVILIVVLSNALMLAAARGFLRGEIKWFKQSGQRLDLFKGEKEAQELSERMSRLREEKKEEG